MGEMTALPDFFRRAARSRLNLLLVFAPLSWIVGWRAPDTVWPFVLGATSIVPLARLIGAATEELATHTGPALGGFLNATFGNAAEIIIGLVALRANHLEVVQASITGSIIGNLLLVFGASAFVGGIGRVSQRFNRTSAGNATIMLFLGVVALTIPAVFDLTLFGSLERRPPALYTLSVGTSLLLIVAYAGSLVYSLTTGRTLIGPHLPAHTPRKIPLWPPMVVLAVATAFTTVQAEVLVGGLSAVLARSGMSELFAGVIIIALIGNAAEHYSAIAAARRDEMTLAVEIAIGSSAQIALLVAPVLVLASFALGQPMTLLFHPFEIAAVVLSVCATAIVALDGESNWVEGLQLLAVYLILALAFYLIPAGGGSGLQALGSRLCLVTCLCTS
ncbi:MAG TPA: calcium/proton exchanger [Vicinamibacterales bacterium]|jgi:Ca2+:H+ antiporter